VKQTSSEGKGAVVGGKKRTLSRAYRGVEVGWEIRKEIVRKWEELGKKYHGLGSF